MKIPWLGHDRNGNPIAKGDPVRLGCEPYRVVRLDTGRTDRERHLIIQNLIGYRKSVKPEELTVGWN